ncbi:DUF6366 family protein [Bacillus sp. ISL-7]|uniref:DUF6366 family protein n=1 Tax=Bacillus sp. ISL-7 TaxID=2819136 RepID=UPI001BE958F4|nr:DUF6366 family protein [Bacillus sp. ISL-7]MBT2738607.1 hypothetical protein [Bacillus sp. ISL-7]
MNTEDEQEKNQNQVNKENPMGNLGEAINRSMVGNLGALANGGCLTKIITVVIIIGGLLILSRCSN